MANDLIDNYDQKGKTQNEIVRLLGEPGNGVSHSPEHFYYDLGPCRRGIDYGSLVITFNNGKVSDIEKHCH